MLEYADVIVDLAYGDSGKGKVAKELSKSGEYTHCIRYNGSNNAGHTVYNDGKKIVTHSIPTGIIHGLKCIIGPGCVLNVDQFFSELDELKKCGVDVENKIFIAKNVHIIMDHHIKEDSKDSKIGTTKRGNGPAYRDKFNRAGVRAVEVEALRPYLIDLYHELHSRLYPSRVLFEGAQGFGLDIDWGDYPYVTSSTCMVGAAVANGVPPQKIRKVFGVTKAYETYVGLKNFEPNDPIFEELRKLGNEYGATTGRPRQCNWLNMELLEKAIKLNGVTDLIINKTDILTTLDVFKAYDEFGKLHQFKTEAEFKRWVSHRIPPPVMNIIWSYRPDAI